MGSPFLQHRLRGCAVRERDRRGEGEGKKKGKRDAKWARWAASTNEPCHHMSRVITSQYNAVCVHTHKSQCLNTTLRVCTHIRRNACTYIYYSICIHLHTCYVPYIIHICVHVPPCWWAFRGEHSTAHQQSHPCLKKKIQRVNSHACLGRHSQKWVHVTWVPRYVSSEYLGTF